MHTKKFSELEANMKPESIARSNKIAERIQTEDENDASIRRLEELTDKVEPTAEEVGEIVRLSERIEEFEDQHYPIDTGEAE
jgi:iron-sulfur cluster repair protein YtfE (RIC family)